LRTQEAYTRAVRMLSTFYSKPPDDVTEPELEAYFLRRRNVDHWSPNTIRICVPHVTSAGFVSFIQLLGRVVAPRAAVQSPTRSKVHDATKHTLDRAIPMIGVLNQ
jgi:Phage integrase, N-terminal SAM-like domain